MSRGVGTGGVKGVISPFAFFAKGAEVQNAIIAFIQRS